MKALIKKRRRSHLIGIAKKTLSYDKRDKAKIARDVSSRRAQYELRERLGMS